jgi:signal peptidase II
LRVLLFSFFIVFFDQLTKLMVKGISIPFLGIHFTGFSYGVSRPIIGDLVRLTYIENAGMAFGFDVGGKHLYCLFSIFASIIIIIYLYKMRRQNLGFRLSLAMILGGALGNLIDRVFYGTIFGYGRLFYGRVVDFVDVDFFNINIFGYHLDRWPVFNVADASVTVGIILLLLFHHKTLENKQAIETAQSEPMKQKSGFKET